ncbi:MFS transporter [Ramlibacter alkalitolerans]|uniref:MFS transporter n=1 Tax=Ramlibacter alkalitolerans TaxID=2039631 RepID=A0ABS1JMH5_9BURK|nr:MFS transporter [Ramlibacter alkalitolerans]MBL0425331.1 MFS transporter [Ramlibacter alkalitolerans]
MIEKLARRLPFFYGWVVVGVVFLTMAICVNARTAFSLIFPPIIDEFGWERGVTAGAFSFGFVVSAVLSPLLGRLMDRRGPRVVMEIGIVATAAGLLLATFTHEPWHVYATLGMLVGAGTTFTGYTGQALFLPNWFVRRRGLAISVAFAGVGFGSIVMLPALQTFVERNGWRAGCTMLGVTVLVVLVPLNLLLRRGPEEIGLAPDGDGDTPAAARARRVNVVDPAWAAVDWTLARAMRTARFWWIAVAYFAALFAWYAVQVHQTKYLTETGFSAQQAAWALGAVSLAGVPGQIALGWLSDRIGREVVWAIGNLGFLVTYAALLALPAHPGMPMLYVIVTAQGAIGYGLTSVVGAIPAEIFEGRHYGPIFGTLMLSALAGGAMGPWFMGFVHDRTGTYTLAFWFAIGCTLLSAFAVWRAAPSGVRVVAGRVRAAQADQAPGTAHSTADS